MKELDFHPIQEIEDIFVATNMYLDNLKVREGADQKDIFSSSNLMLLDKENITRVYIDDYFKQNEIETNQILEISNMDLLIEFAKISLGVACVIKEFVLDDIKKGSLTQLPLDVSVPKRQVGFVYSTHGYQSDSVHKFIDFYKNVDFPTVQ
jgi:DNA-binding transcriptional LysR family regulator